MKSRRFECATAPVRRVLVAFALLACAAACGGSRSAAGADPVTSFACDNVRFANDRRAFAAGSISTDQLVDVCGRITRVLRARTTRSGRHGYFYLRTASGEEIEIVANLDAMAEAASDRPPATWPWVTPGAYVYVQGRYYYDGPARQGIDWTEGDTGSWPYTGYVAVCTAAGAGCAKYW